MIFGITMGDASGIGPEIILKAFRDGQLRVDAMVFGDLAILEHCNRKLAYGVQLRKAAGAADHLDGFLNVMDLCLLGVDGLRIGEVSATSGKAAREYVVAATRAALNGEIAAVVTLPLNKEAVALSDPGFTGHTELIASLCGVEEAILMLASGRLLVSHVSTHMSLREAIQRVRRDRIARVIELTATAAAKLRDSPRIAVAGVNPHAGENGLFGREEIDEIRPAVEWARSRGLAVEGPFPPDTIFHLAVSRKRFDAVVCMYHDQGHIPLKLLDFESAVNVTLGLPIVRTSVDHGTAFDIAWQGVASPQSFIAAVHLAARLAA